MRRFQHQKHEQGENLIKFVEPEHFQKYKKTHKIIITIKTN